MKSAERERFWNCWTTNLGGGGDSAGYIIHVFELTESGHATARTLCGVRWAETGMLNLNETEPGCIKCRNALRRRGHKFHDDK